MLNYTIGYAFPTLLRTGGIDYSFGLKFYAMAHIVIGKINADPSLLEGVNLLGVHKDILATNQGAIEGALYLCHQFEPGVIGVVGDWWSSRTVYIAQVAAIFDVPHVSFAATSPLLSDKSRFPTFMRTVPPDTLQGMCLAELIYHYGWTHVNSFSSTDDYGAKCIEVFHTHAHSLGIDLGMYQSFSDDETDFDELMLQLEVLKQSEVKVIVGCASPMVFLMFLEAAESVGMLQAGYAWLGGDSIMSEWATASKPQAGMANILGSTPAYNLGSDTELWKEVVEAWDSFEESEGDGFHAPPGGIIDYSTYLVDALYLYAYALEAALENNVDPLADRSEFLEIMRGVEFDGATGHVTLDDSGDRMGGYDILNAYLTEGGSVAFGKVGTWELDESASTLPSDDEQSEGTLRGVLEMDPEVSVLFAGNTEVVPIAYDVSDYESDSTSGVILGLVVTMAVAVVLATGAFFRYHRRMRRKVRGLESIVSFGEAEKKVVREVMRTESGDDILSSRLSVDNISKISKIGTGAYGDVWRGTLNGKPCAIKFMKANQISEISMKQFKREIQIMRRIRHPNIIDLLGACWDPPNIMLVLELADTSLFDRLTDSKLPPMSWKTHKIDMAIGVATGMAYLHSLQPAVLHRDLKSLNVLLDVQMNAKLADFGNSREIDREGIMTMSGTLYWLAPEITSGAQYNESADVYSFAIVLCEMAVEGGRVSSMFPTGGTPLLAARNILQGWRPNLDALPTDLSSAGGVREVLERCWRSVPTDRPSFVEVVQLLCDAKAALDGEESRGVFDDTKVSLFRSRNSLPPAVRGAVDNDEMEQMRLLCEQLQMRLATSEVDAKKWRERNNTVVEFGESHSQDDVATAKV